MFLFKRLAINLIRVHAMVDLGVEEVVLTTVGMVVEEGAIPVELEDMFGLVKV